ncbi:hypothetical protein BGX38DRAFT_221039 [Terfezia claveryi]|nr:hypothetical protein BGX38DRAFT_221039 [Terfezia claveryi]
MFARKGMQHILNLLTPGRKRRIEEVEDNEQDTDDWFSDIDSRPQTPQYFNQASLWQEHGLPLLIQPEPENHVAPHDPDNPVLYLSRLRIWCCQCLHMSNYSTALPEKEQGEDLMAKTWPCLWCRENLPRTHFFCDDCALVQITSTRLQPLMRYAWCKQALNVYEHPMYRSGGIGQHGVQFYVVECCKPGCSGSFRVDLDAAEKRKNLDMKGYPVGLWTDFGDWLCPECGQRACKYCLKYLVGTQVICGGEKSRGWVMSRPIEDGLAEEAFQQAQVDWKTGQREFEESEAKQEARRRELEVLVAAVSGRAKPKHKISSHKPIPAPGQDPEVMELGSEEEEEDLEPPRSQVEEGQQVQ